MELRQRGVLTAAVAVGMPSRVNLLLAAVSYFLIWCLSNLAAALPLPFDRHFTAVLYLMWSANTEIPHYLIPITRLDTLVCAAGFLAALAGAAIPSDWLPEGPRRVIRVLYRYAVALPLFYLLATNLGRYVANSVYAMARPVTWDLTPLLGKLETPLLEWLQGVLYSPLLSEVCSLVYSIVWIFPQLTIGVVLVALDRPKALNLLIAGYFWLSVLVIPFFVLLPVFDPWTTNPVYGNPGAWRSQISYLYPNPDLPVLGQINRQLKWATACCLPSLHVSVPLMLYWITRRNNLRLLSLLFLIVLALNIFAVVYLGRHWILDIILAVPYTYAVVRFVERVNLNFVLG